MPGELITELDTELGNDRVQVFGTDGTWSDTWGGSGVGAGSLSDPEGIAVDASNTVFVADSGNDRVQAFTTRGEALAYIDDVATKLNDATGASPATTTPSGPGRVPP